MTAQNRDPEFAAATVARVRVSDLRPGDLLIGSSRTVVTTPGRDGLRRRRVQLLIETTDGNRRLVIWRADTLVFVRRPITGTPPRADIDG